MGNYPYLGEQIDKTVKKWVDTHGKSGGNPLSLVMEKHLKMNYGIRKASATMTAEDEQTPPSTAPQPNTPS